MRPYQKPIRTVICETLDLLADSKARIAQLEAALRAVEFSVGRYSNRCVICTYERIDGHAPDCLIGKALNP